MGTGVARGDVDLEAKAVLTSLAAPSPSVVSFPSRPGTAGLSVLSAEVSIVVCGRSEGRQ